MKSCVTPETSSVAARIISTGWPIEPRPDPCECGQPRHLHSGPARTGPAWANCTGYRHDPGDALAQAVLAADSEGALAAVERHNQARRDGRRMSGWGISPSDAGSCSRKLWYRENPPGGYQPPPAKVTAASVGTAVHGGATEAHEAQYPWRLHALVVTVPGLDQQGEIDSYDPITATITDWKTGGRAAWGRLAAGPEPRHIKQLLIYGLGAIRDGYEVRRIRLVYICKETGEEEVFTYRFDEQAAHRALAELVEIADELDAGIEPERQRTGPGSDWECQYCPAVAHCWNLRQAEEAGRSPESFTVLGSDPDHAVIAEAAELAGLAGEAWKAAEVKAKQARALVSGVPLGDYGPWEVYRGTTTSVDYKTPYGELADAWADPDRYSAEALPQPRRSSTPWTSVRRARASKVHKPAPITTTDHDGV